jgi:hypothetical protein
MKNNNWKIVFITFLCVLVFSQTSCEKVKQANDLFVKKGIEFLKSSKSKNSLCPDNMAKVDNFCIDLYEFPNDVGYYPFVNKTWFQAQADCGRRNKRLCTSSEWEKACRGTESYRYPYGNTYNHQNCRTEAKEVAMVATHKNCISPFGVYDMVGNVWEWTTSEDGSAVSRVYGGHWTFGEAAKCTIFSTFTKNHSSENIGFRCCK